MAETDSVVHLTKTCPRCKVLKSLNDFTIRETGNRKGQAVAHCKKCMVEKFKERKARDPSIYRRIEWPSKLKRYYGITVENYYLMLGSQGGVCAICRCATPRKKKSTRDNAADRFFVDHCHKTGRVRGLLCNNCNQAVGHVHDDPHVAERLAEYLRR